MRGTFGFGEENGGWGWSGGTYNPFFVATPVKNDKAAVTLHVSRHEIDFDNNSTSTTDKNTTVSDTYGAFEKEKFDTELSQLINTLIKIRETIHKHPTTNEFGNPEQAVFSMRSPKKTTISVTLTYHE